MGVVKLLYKEDIQCTTPIVNEKEFAEQSCFFIRVGKDFLYQTTNQCLEVGVVMLQRK